MTGTFYACAPPESQAPGIPIEPSIRSAEALALSGECSASLKARREVASLLCVDLDSHLAGSGVWSRPGTGYVIVTVNKEHH